MLEIEAKFKAEDFTAIRDLLRASGAQSIGVFQETNTFFDTQSRDLLAKDRGLRLRRNRNISTTREDFLLTYKGPQQSGPLKTREEIELTVSDATSAAAMLRALGYTKISSFEKHRESWKLGECKIELDDLPQLGKFIEIEGPSADAVHETARTLQLDHLAPITTSYIAMIMKQR
jgi:adenylate cyclase, class 2